MIAYVGLGSNLGDRRANLSEAQRLLAENGLVITAASSVYETEPFGVTEPQPDYLNMVVAVEAGARSAEELLALLLKIESQLGRRRDTHLAPRTIDLDLLLYGDEQIQSATLTLPHPRLHLRRFVLVPLVEIFPEGIHPVLGTSYAQLLEDIHNRTDRTDKLL